MPHATAVCAGGLPFLCARRKLGRCTKRGKLYENALYPVHGFVTLTDGVHN